jgi:ABC-type multidrug transport system permease subunit
LVLFFPLIWYFFPIKKLSEIKKWNRKDYLNFLVVALWIFTILATLSRAAIVGLVLCLFFIFYPQLKKHKKFALWIGVMLVLLLIGVSCWKWDSTVQHIQAKLD